MKICNPRLSENHFFCLAQIMKMVLLSMTLRDLLPRFQGHDIFEVEYRYLKDKVTIAQ